MHMATAESSLHINEEGTPSTLAERFTDRQLRIGGFLIAASAAVATLVMADSWPGDIVAQGPQLPVEQLDTPPQLHPLGRPLSF